MKFEFYPKFFGVNYLEIIGGLHSIFIHFPIAFLFLFIILEILNIFLRKSFISKSSHLLLLLGVIGGIFAVLTGNQAAQSISEKINNLTLYKELIEEHQYYATLTLWLFFFLLILKTYLSRLKKENLTLYVLFLIFTLFSSYLLFKTAKLGGIIVYDFGIGTKLFL